MNVTGNSLGLKSVKGRVLKVSEIASFLRVSERWVHKHMDDGTFPIPWFPFGDRTRGVDSVVFDNWLNSIVVSAGKASLPTKAVKKIKEAG